MAHSEDRFVREPERENVTGLSRTTWWRMEQQGLAPRRRTLSRNSVGWLLSEIREWLAQREIGGPGQDERLRKGQQRHLAARKSRRPSTEDTRRDAVE
jgi:predicted DNA-binding transcriptional regulator AlpA